MTFWPWLLAVSLAAQSLAEVAEKERDRRKRNAEAGVEVLSYTSRGGGISQDEPKERDEAPGAAITAGEPTDQDVSPLEESRERGKLLEPRMAEISAMADRVDGLYERYMNQCYGRYLIGETPPGFGLPFQPSPPAGVRWDAMGSPFRTCRRCPRHRAGASSSSSRRGARRFVKRSSNRRTQSNGRCRRSWTLPDVRAFSRASSGSSAKNTGSRGRVGSASNPRARPHFASFAASKQKVSN